MTRREALNILHNSSVYHPDYLDALQMAIEALEQEPCEDAISRQENNELYKKIDDAIDDIENLEKIELSLGDLGGDVGSGWFVCIDEVLEIIKSI